MVLFERKNIKRSDINFLSNSNFLQNKIQEFNANYNALWLISSEKKILNNAHDAMTNFLAVSENGLVDESALDNLLKCISDLEKDKKSQKFAQRMATIGFVLIATGMVAAIASIAVVVLPPPTLPLGLIVVCLASYLGMNFFGGMAMGAGSTIWGAGLGISLHSMFKKPETAPLAIIMQDIKDDFINVDHSSFVHAGL